MSNSSLHTIEKGKLKIKLETATLQVFFDLTPYQAVNQLIHNCSIPTLYSPAGDWIEHVAGLGLDLRKVREEELPPLANKVPSSWRAARGGLHHRSHVRV